MWCVDSASSRSKVRSEGSHDDHLVFARISIRCCGMANNNKLLGKGNKREDSYALRER